MEWLNKNSFLKWLVIVLLAFNLLSLAFIWFDIFNRREPAREMKPGPPPNNDIFLQKELKLTNEQAQKFEEKRKEFFSSSDRLFTKMNMLQNELTKHLLNQDYNLSYVDSVANQIGKTQTSLEELRFNHFKDLLTICTPEQRDKFIPIIIKITERIPPDDRKGNPRFQNNNQPGRPPAQLKD